MGTEIFPQLLDIIQFLLLGIGTIATVVAIANVIQHIRVKNPAARDKTKQRLLDALITLLLTMIVFFALSSIGPFFRILF